MQQDPESTQEDALDAEGAADEREAAPPPAVKPPGPMFPAYAPPPELEGSPIRRTIERARRFIWDERHETGSIGYLLLWRWVQIAERTVWAFKSHQCALRASALTYTTLLSFIPLLAVIFSIMKGFGVQDAIADAAIARMVPTSAEVGQSQEMLEETVLAVRDFVNNSEVLSLGVLGMLGLLGVALSMLVNIEKALNAIWGVGQMRGYVRRTADYLAVFLMAPFLLLIGTAMTAFLRSPQAAEWAGPLSGILESLILKNLLRALPVLIVCAVFGAIYQYLPNTKVRMLSSIWGGIFAGISWQVAQVIYIEYSKVMTQGRWAIAGGFGWVLMFLVWVYISWSILLAGAECTWAHQHLDQQRRLKRPWRGTPAQSETLALRLGVLLTRPLLAPLNAEFAPPTARELADALRLPTVPVIEILGLFARAGLVTQVAGEEPRFMLCRLPEDVQAADILRLVRYGTLEPAGDNGPGFLDAAGDALGDAMAGQTLRDLAALPLKEIQTFTLGQGAVGAADA